MSSDDRLRAALERALADARAQLEPELLTLTHELSGAASATLASAVASLDRAESLADVLRALADAAAAYADGVGLFLVRDGSLRPWRLHGLEAGALPPLVSLAAARRDGGGSNVPVDRATTFPVAVGGEMVAILYADGAAPGPGALDVLTRYAGRLLESRTLHMALGMPAR